MRLLTDPNLGAAPVYLVIACMYLRREHSRACRMTLATAALLLAVCAAAKSDNVRDWLWHHPKHTSDFSKVDPASFQPPPFTPP
jgi:hypothetical protein